MTKAKLMALMAVMAMLLVLPAMVLAQAQPPRPAVFGGSATLDGATAANGTTVTATIDGVVAATTTVSGGNYAFSIAQPPGLSFAGKEITFKVGVGTATETATWNADGGAVLNLTAVTGPPPRPGAPDQVGVDPRLRLRRPAGLESHAGISERAGAPLGAEVGPVRRHAHEPPLACTADA